MKRKALVLFACVLVSCLNLAQAKSAEKKAPAKTTSAKTAGAPSKELLKTILDAWATMNPDNVAKYYDQDPNDVFYDVAPVKYTGWQQYAAGVKGLAGTLQGIKFMLNDDAAVQTAGNLAWGTATVATEMTDKTGKTTHLDTRWTVIWQKKGANWVIVHDHFSAAMEPPK